VSSVGNYTPKLFFDGANGVGAEKMANLSKNLDDLLQVWALAFTFHTPPYRGSVANWSTDLETNPWSITRQGFLIQRFL